MKRLLKRFLARAVRAGLPRGLAETLGPVNQQPVVWDQAATDLEKLHSYIKPVGYPYYLYGLLCAARTARAIGAPRFTAIEFGVAGGNGLLALEQHALTVERQWDVSIDVVGFDNSLGLPQRTDPRDCPFAFSGGEFPMDETKLRLALHRADLRLGDVAETVRSFSKEKFAPVGFISNDLDLYTSTRDSFILFHLEPSRFLPRVTMYFDDLFGYPYTSVTGEWAAINEFNSASERMKLGRIHGLNHSMGHRYRLASWPEKFFVLHVFDHPDYSAPEMTAMPVLTLRN